MHESKTLLALLFLTILLTTAGMPPARATSGPASANSMATAPADAEQHRTLTLDQCIALAKKNSPNIRAADNALSSAALARKGLSGARLPQVRANGTASAAPTFDRYGYDAAITDHGQLSAQIIAEEKLYDGGIYGLRAQQMQLDLENLGIARKISERDIVFSVKQSFIEILRAREEIALQRRSLSQLTDYYDLVKNLNAAGRVQYTDVLKTGIQLSSANASLERAEEAAVVAKYELSGMMDAAPDTAFEVSGSLDDLSIESPDTTAAGAAPRSLESASNDLGVARSGLDAEMIRREKFPTLSLIADAGFLSSLDPPAADRWDRFGYSAGISLDVPLLDWGQRRLREQQQRLAVENARYQAEAFDRSQAIELRTLSLQIRNLERRLNNLRSTAKDADDNYTLTKSKYLGGAAPVTEVLAAQQLATDTRIEELAARSDMLKLSARAAQILAR
ncbi:MAG: TolC family protein [Candidatus Krumholzibacteriaceae bacterium]|jgi:outer membrane protein TolC